MQELAHGAPQARFARELRYEIVSHDWLMMTLERRRDLITVLEPYFLPETLHSTRS